MMGLKVKDFVYLGILFLLYIIYLYLARPIVFHFVFNPNSISIFYRSQVIPSEVDGRVFLSDTDQIISTGYLQVLGMDPTKYMFEHPPLIKYFVGFSLLAFKNPYIVQIIFGSLYLFGTYFLSLQITGRRIIGVLSTILLLIDPLFFSVTTILVMDLGQAVFALYYVISIISLNRKWLLQGILLGLLSASKFWSTAIFFFIFSLLLLNFDYKNRKHRKHVLYLLIVTGLVFSMTYIRTFIINGGLFNLPLMQLKIFKFWFQHSVSSGFGQSIYAFITGYSHLWNNSEVIRMQEWNIFWPIGLVVENIPNVNNSLDASRYRSPNITLTTTVGNIL